MGRYRGEQLGAQPRTEGRVPALRGEQQQLHCGGVVAQHVGAHEGAAGRGRARAGGQTQHEAARQMLQDPTGALLRMGIDDAAVLSAAPSLVKAASSVRRGQGVRNAETPPAPSLPLARAAVEESDEEEAPNF